MSIQFVLRVQSVAMSYEPSTRGPPPRSGRRAFTTSVGPVRRRATAPVSCLPRVPGRVVHANLKSWRCLTKVRMNTRHATTLLRALLVLANTEVRR